MWSIIAGSVFVMIHLFIITRHENTIKPANTTLANTTLANTTTIHRIELELARGCFNNPRTPIMINGDFTGRIPSGTIIISLNNYVKIVTIENSNIIKVIVTINNVEASGELATCFSTLPLISPKPNSTIKRILETTEMTYGYFTMPNRGTSGYQWGGSYVSNTNVFPIIAILTDQGVLYIYHLVVITQVFIKPLYLVI